jgi:hypothetical protein
VIATLLLGAVPATSPASTPAQPIPEGPNAGQLPTFIGSPATAKPVSAPQPPRHPFMAPNGLSNIHDDAYMSDTYSWSGPLGVGTQRLSTFQAGECASLVFDSAGRIVTICVGLEGPRLVLFDPQTLDLLAAMPLPPRDPTSGNPFTSFSGGGYFYLDDSDRAVISTTTRHVWVIGETAEPGFQIERDYDLGLQVPPGDQIVSALPDWSGRIWFVSNKGVVGTIDPASGAVKVHGLTNEGITNSFAVDESGGVYIVSDKALYRFDAAADGTPTVSWRKMYDNSGIKKPGQSDAGSGTTPTLMGSEYVAITDNADPMDVVVYRRGRDITAGRVVCTQPVFAPGQGATDNSLIGTDTAMVVENNYGYSGPAATENGGTVPGGLERVDVNADGSGCHAVWTSSERAPSVVPKLSLANGLVYTYTKDPQPDNQDSWYLTALDFETGQTVFKRLGGEGLGYNNNYAPVTIGPSGTLYVGALGGLVLIRDAYAVPRSASSLTVSLVPAFRPCDSAGPPNAGHSPPLGVPSCSPPEPTSAGARVGPTSAGSASLTVVPGDVGLNLATSDVQTPAGLDYDPVAGSGDLTGIARIRFTDLANCTGAGCSGPYTKPATGTDLDFSIPMSCAPTADPVVGSTCSASTTANTLVPGAVSAGRQALVQVFRVRVYDSADTLFEQQGVYIP